MVDYNKIKGETNGRDKSETAVGSTAKSAAKGIRWNRVVFASGLAILLLFLSVPYVLKKIPENLEK